MLHATLIPVPGEGPAVHSQNGNDDGVANRPTGAGRIVGSERQRYRTCGSVIGAGLIPRCSAERRSAYEASVA